MQTNGNFHPQPAFANRVTQVDNAGLAITQMIQGDSGNYSVEVHVTGPSGSQVLKSSVVIQVSGNNLSK